MIKPLLKTMVLGAAVAALPMTSQAALYMVTASLDAAQEVHKPASPAVGDFHAIYDDQTNVFNYVSLVGGGLVGTSVTGLHIHGVPPTGGPVNTNSGIALGFAHAGVSLLPGNAFTFNTTGAGGLPTGADTTSTFSNDEEALMFAGKSYVNLHTNVFGAGEIRGQLQVTPVPEPETYALMLAGLGVVGWVASRRRKIAV